MAGAGVSGMFAAYPIFARLFASIGYSSGASMLKCGLYLLSMVAAMGLDAVLARRLVDAFSSVHVLVAGSGLAALGFGFMALWHGHPYDMMISLALAGIGFGVVLADPVRRCRPSHTPPKRRRGERDEQV